MTSAAALCGFLLFSLLYGGQPAEGISRHLVQGLQSRPRALENGAGQGGYRDRVKLFRLLVKLAEDLYADTNKLEPAVMQLRVAFAVCPACRFDDFPGKKFRETFSIDNLNDRVYLTEVIFPAIVQQPKSSSVPFKMLWAGSHPYTLRYEYLLKEIDFVSMDPNPEVAVYGSQKHHLVDFLQNVGRYHQPGTFDIALVNGVIGWGIDSEAQLDSFVKAMHSAIKPNGFLMIGSNRHMTQCCKFGSMFKAEAFRDLPQRKDFEGQWQHSFEWYRRT